MTLSVASDSFMEGYRLALAQGADRDPERIVGEVLALGPRRAPFAFEGAALGCRIQDEREAAASTDALLREAPAIWRPFLALGVGCALARLHRPPPEDPVVLDGYGFQQGLLAGVSGLGSGCPQPRAERGRGRALWFLTGGRGQACAAVARRSAHAGELWRGIGTACAFAGDPMDQAARLPGLAGGCVGSLSAGVADGVSMWQALEPQVPPWTRRVQEALAAVAPPRGRERARETGGR